MSCGIILSLIFRDIFDDVRTVYFHLPAHGEDVINAERGRLDKEDGTRLSRAPD